MSTKKELIKAEKIKSLRIKELINTPEALEYRREEYKKVMLAVLAKRLKEVRKAKGYTQAELAKKMGVKQPEIVRIEKGENYFNFDTILGFLFAIDGRFEVIY